MVNETLHDPIQNELCSNITSFQFLLSLPCLSLESVTELYLEKNKP